MEVNPPSQQAKRIWLKVLDLANQFGADQQWCLIGGLMVQLHAYEHEAAPRPTSDIDMLGDARQRPSVTEQLAKILDRLGASLSLPPSTDPRLGYQFEIDGQIVEILGPDGLKDPAHTLGNHETIMVGGGTQALRRVEKVTVSVAGGLPTTVRRPTLLGAILLKAKALKSAPEKLDDHRQDLILLLSLVQDPRALSEDEGLTKTERQWLRTARRELDLDDPALPNRFTEAQIRRARQALDLLTAP